MDVKSGRRLLVTVLFVVIVSSVSARVGSYRATSAPSTATTTKSHQAVTTKKPSYGQSSSSSAATKSSYGYPSTASATTSPSYGYPSVTSGPTLPTKPIPAPGATAPSADSYSATTGRPYDFFTGISLQQLGVFLQYGNIINQAAAGSSAPLNDTDTRGAEVYGTVVDYILSLWFPEDARKFGLPFNRNGTDGGGQQVTTQSYWENSNANLVATRYGRSLFRLYSHVALFDPIGFARELDDIVYSEYLLFKSYGSNLGDVVAFFLHQTIVQTAAQNYLLGSNYTDEAQAALRNVLRFVNWRSAVTLDLYQRGVFSRYEGPENDACSAITPLDLVPAEVAYPIMSNSTSTMMNGMSYGSYPNGSQPMTGPVDPHGRPKKKQAMGRQLSGDATDNATATGQPQPVGTSGQFSQPQPAAGATPLTPPAFSATVGKNVDTFSGIAFDQLAIGLEAWKNVTKAAAAASGVNETDGAKVFAKQSVYTLYTEHAEYSPISAFSDIEQIWTNASADAAFGTDGMDLDNQIVGLCQNNPAMTGRLIDRTAFRRYMETRDRGEAWYSLPFFAWTTDSNLEAATFFLGDSLTDEGYSALESIFSFISLKTYQVYHAYNNGYRVRPFASDWEMIGGQACIEALGLMAGCRDEE